MYEPQSDQYVVILTYTFLYTTTYFRIVDRIVVDINMKAGFTLWRQETLKSVDNFYYKRHSMKQSYSWQTNCNSTSQEISRILLNTKVHYRVYKSP